MATVFLDGPNNSTLFTTCCEVAILDHQGNCPDCGQDVEPKTRTARWETAYGPIRRKVRWYGNWYPNHGEGRKRGMSSNALAQGPGVSSPGPAGATGYTAGTTEKE